MSSCERLRTVPTWLLLLGALIINGFSYEAAAQSACGSLDNAIGPFDYTSREARTGGWGGNAKISPLAIVEQFHFYREIENLSHPPTSLIGDLDYTLRAFPNHHRALYAVSRLERELKGGIPQPEGPEVKYPHTAECYFDRAIRFRPNDPTVHLLYGLHLHALGQKDKALESYKISERLFPDSPDLQYNMGLLYLDLGDYAQALQHAKRAYALGHRLPGLRDKLTKLGQWQE